MVNIPLPSHIDDNYHDADEVDRESKKHNESVVPTVEGRSSSQSASMSDGGGFNQ